MDGGARMRRRFMFKHSNSLSGNVAGGLHLNASCYIRRIDCTHDNPPDTPVKFSIQALWPVTQDLERVLRRRGIVDSEQLLAATRTQGARAALAIATGLSVIEVYDMAIRADLARVRGIGYAYAELLLAAGVDRTQMLARWPALALRARLAVVNAERLITQRLPSLRQVTDWIAEAEQLPPILE